MSPCVSVLMPCFNPGPYLLEAVASVLSQAECLELIIADGGSTDGSLANLVKLQAGDPRLKIYSEPDRGPADALNKAFSHVRGTFIGWLNADDLYTPGALKRAYSALAAHPEWLMVYGEAEEFDANTGLLQRYPTLPPHVGLEQFRSHCFICQPSVVFRRSMAVLLGAFDTQWQTAFDFDYWLRAFATFPQRIGYIPHIQGRTRLHKDTITSRQRSQIALEATQLLARHFGSDTSRLHSYALELTLGIAELPAGEAFLPHLRALFDQAAPWLSSNASDQLRRTWLEGQLPVPPQARPCRWQSAGIGTAKTISHTRFPQRPFGVNLIGHAFEVFGIGEDVRMAARALQAAGVPCCVIHHPAANGADCSDRSLEPLLCSDPAGGPYAFNLVCMAAPIQARWLRQVGCDPLRERYTLTSWPWETQRWPEAWKPLLQVADELWPSSSFTAGALAAAAAEVRRNPDVQAGIPLEVMPMAAEIPDPDRFCDTTARSAARARHGLPAAAVLFGYSFDLNSTAIRKNPMAAVEAFQLAFPLPHLPATFGRDCNHHSLSANVALLIKSFPPKRFSAEWHWLQSRAAEDPRIHLIAESLAREELLALYGCCDVFLSLHRSEGFGRGIAEALQLGLDVIATDFGGNTDFCTGPLTHAVSYRLAPIPRGAYPEGDSHHWGEPNLEHAAELCREVASRRLALATESRVDARDPSRDSSVLSAYRQRFSFADVGARYRRRLEDLWRDRDTIGEQLRWRADRSPVA